jgi:hypothetical protein
MRCCTKDEDGSLEAALYPPGLDEPRTCQRVWWRTCVPRFLALSFQREDWKDTCFVVVIGSHPAASSLKVCRAGCSSRHVRRSRTFESLVTRKDRYAQPTAS